MTTTPVSNAAKPYGMLAILWLVGWTLRITVLVIPPLAINIADDFQLAEIGVGALTMVPMVAIAFGALAAALIINRFSLKGAIIAGLLIMAAASVARGQVDTANLLFIMSAIMGLGIAIFQTALPAATRAWTPTHVALGSAVYLNGMMMGEMICAGLTLPVVMPLANEDWRQALVLWAIPIVLIALLVMVSKPQVAQPNKGTSEQASTPTLPRLNDMTVWQFSLLYATAIITFLIINAYCGSILRQRNELDALDGFIFAYNSMPLFGSFVILARPRWVGLRNPIGVTGIASILGLACFAFFTGWPAWIGACVTAFAATIMLILLLSVPAYIADGKAITRLSAGMTLLGFGISFALSILGGWLADTSGSNDMALMPSLVFALISLGFLGRHRVFPSYT